MNGNLFDILIFKFQELALILILNNRKIWENEKKCYNSVFQYMDSNANLCMLFVCISSNTLKKNYKISPV